ncbi:hypothetical protein NOVOSPHI9U_210045 [Novosphingobium sp. 9U]|nr:hypothetical protein NOVOSPHI9U_210045 [Novosphingobium sp. 9U]
MPIVKGPTYVHLPGRSRRGGAVCARVTARPARSPQTTHVLPALRHSCDKERMRRMLEEEGCTLYSEEAMWAEILRGMKELLSAEDFVTWEPAVKAWWDANDQSPRAPRPQSSDHRNPRCAGQEGWQVPRLRLSRLITKAPRSSPTSTHPRARCSKSSGIVRSRQLSVQTDLQLLQSSFAYSSVHCRHTRPSAQVFRS